MIQYTPASQRKLSLFRTPFEQSLDANNRWVAMAEVVPWDEMAKVFFASMSADMGRGSVDLRTVLGALLVKHVEGISDEDTIVYIQENIYAQYFVGLPSFQTAPVFSATLFVEIRKRLGEQGVVYLNEMVLKQAKHLQAIKHRAQPQRRSSQQDNQDGSDGNSGTTAKADHSMAKTTTDDVPHRGRLKLDATVAPQHIGYPTDTGLLNNARLSSEELIDVLYYGTGHWTTKPRTYRKVAKNKYLAFAKKRKKNKKAIRRTKREQLGYLRRNLGHINKMLDQLEAEGRSIPWTHYHWRRFWVLQEFFRQQEIMYKDGRRQMDHRIVNIAQPFVRPIKRGKAGADTEFGAKINMSETEGFCRMDRVDFDNFNEGTGLKAQVEAYKQLYGYYPEVVLADRVYLNRVNRKYLKDNGIRTSGPPLGRPPQLTKHEKEKRRKENNKRSHIEGKFGQAKSKYGLDDIKTRRQDTSYACIGLILLALNAKKLAEQAFDAILTLLSAFIDPAIPLCRRFKIDRRIWASHPSVICLLGASLG